MVGGKRKGRQVGGLSGGDELHAGYHFVGRGRSRFAFGFGLQGGCCTMPGGGCTMPGGGGCDDLAAFVAAGGEGGQDGGQDGGVVRQQRLLHLFHEIAEPAEGHQAHALMRAGHPLRHYAGQGPVVRMLGCLQLYQEFLRITATACSARGLSQQVAALPTRPHIHSFVLRIPGLAVHAPVKCPRKGTRRVTNAASDAAVRLVTWCGPGDALCANLDPARGEKLSETSHI